MNFDINKCIYVYFNFECGPQWKAEKNMVRIEEKKVADLCLKGIN